MVALVSVIIGGAGTLWGPCLGAAVVVLVRDEIGPSLGGHGPLLLGVVFVARRLPAARRDRRRRGAAAQEPRMTALLELDGVSARLRRAARRRRRRPAPRRRRAARADRAQRRRQEHAVQARCSAPSRCRPGPCASTATTSRAWPSTCACAAASRRRSSTRACSRRCPAATTCCWRCSGARARRGGRSAGARARCAQSAEELLARVGLDGSGARPAAALSHGEQRQLEVAIALAAAPRLLLLDEPAAGMSPAETERLATIIESLDRRAGDPDRRARPRLRLPRRPRRQRPASRRAADDRPRGGGARVRGGRARLPRRGLRRRHLHRRGRSS